MEVTWKNVWLILHREVRDQLRDRRTLFMVLVLPIMLYPGLGIGMLQMTMYFTEQPRQVVILNAGELPDPPLVKEGAFPTRWFRSAETSSKLRVLTDAPDDETRLPNVTVDEQKQLLADAARIRELIEQRNKLVVQLAPWNADLADELPGVQSAKLRNAIQNGETPDQPENYEELIDEYLNLKKMIGEQFANSKLQVLMIVPEGFGENLNAVNELLADRSSDSEELMMEIVQLDANPAKLLAAWRESGWEIRHSPWGEPNSFSYLCVKNGRVVYAWSQQTDTITSLLLSSSHDVTVHHRTPSEADHS